MNDEIITPDRVEDVWEVTDKIYDIFDQYNFPASDRGTTLLTMLIRVGKCQVEKGIELDIICDGFRTAFDRAINHLRNFEKSPHE